ncbi:MAG: hypothetical protein HXO17_10370 [Prevotella shahii]|nr:hypothetical protein [Hoylesella shahii]
MIACCTVSAGSNNETDRLKVLEVLQHKQLTIESQLQTLALKLATEEKENAAQRATIDSLQGLCRQLSDTQAEDRKAINEKIASTNEGVVANNIQLQSRTVWGGAIVGIIVFIVIGIAYWVIKRIRRSVSTIDEVRKVQDALQAAQTKMQEESVKLDNKLLEFAEKQLETAPQVTNKAEQDHSLALKVADEIVRIELNMSRMDASVKGYKQLSKAVQRIKDNFSANGYEIVDMLGKPYSDGMKVTANFVSDEGLEQGKQIITGITKPQINYNGKMIQAAQITVSQNI